MIACLAAGPMKMAELMAAFQAMAFPVVTHQAFSNLIANMHRDNEISVDDQCIVLPWQVG